MTTRAILEEALLWMALELRGLKDCDSCDIRDKCDRSEDTCLSFLKNKFIKEAKEHERF